MRIVEVLRPNDALFTEAMNRVLRFSMSVPGSNISVAWYALNVSTAYADSNPRMLLLAILDEESKLKGHFLGFVENSFGRLLGWAYQTELDRGIPLGDRLRTIRDGLAIIEDWARKNNCVALGLGTPHPPKTMQRLFGFKKTVTLMERSLENGGRYERSTR